MPYCGSNPISDMWSENAMRLLAASFRDAVRDGDEREAGDGWRLAATMAGLGFGNAGATSRTPTHTDRGRVKDFRPDGTGGRADRAHGMAVSLTAPEASASLPGQPERHVHAARLAPGMERPNDDAEYLPAALTQLMRDIGIPNGIGGVGYDEGDVPDLVEGTMKQQRLLDTAPRPVTEDDAAAILSRSLENW